MKYNFLMKDAKKMCIIKYKSFLMVLKNHLGGVVQPKYVRNNFHHHSKVLGLLTEVGILRRFYFSGMAIYQLNYSKDLGQNKIRKVTKEMVIRSALRMEHYRSLGLKTFDEILAYGIHGNNLSINIEKEMLERLDKAFKDRGIFLDDFASDENIKMLFKLKANNTYIERVKINKLTVKPQIVIYNVNVSKPAMMAKKILSAYNNIGVLFTDYSLGLECKPSITVHEYGDMEMFNMLVYDELLKHRDFGCFDLEGIKEKVKFVVYDLPDGNGHTYSNLLT